MNLQKIIIGWKVEKLDKSLGGPDTCFAGQSIV